VNPNVEEAFVIPEGAKKLPGMMDNSEMSVTKLSDNSYMVGKGFAFSLFVDAGDHFVAVGGLSGTKARLEALNAELGADKPLRYVVLPEHHRSHLSGVNEMADMGVTFVVHKSHVDALKEKLSKPLAFERILAVDAHHELASGRAKVFDISTIQSAHYLLTYVPEAHLVFVVDEFGTNLVDSVPSADKRMISFRKALEGLKIDVSRIVHIHGRQPLTTTQLVEVTDGYMDQPCPEGESICADE
jgi:glyoxylase-like metal-dependent hydrolase (beta-lactamase superfamily II)